MLSLICRLTALAVVLVIAASGRVHAEATEVRISKGFGITYLPLYVMDHE
ncbi:MAG: hypothetical protein ACM31O_17335 [Bacteroidota bacterium]